MIIFSAPAPTPQPAISRRHRSRPGQRITLLNLRHGRQYATAHRNQAAPEVTAAGDLFRRRQDLPTVLRVPARLFAFCRSTRPRPGAGNTAGGEKKRGDHPYRAGGQLCDPATFLRRPRHRDLIMGHALRLRPATGEHVATLSQAPGRGRGESRGGSSAFRTATEIEIADPFKVVLINPYELGRQPFALAEPAALLKREGFAVNCLDLSLQKLDADLLEHADL